MTPCQSITSKLGQEHYALDESLGHSNAKGLMESPSKPLLEMGDLAEICSAPKKTGPLEASICA